jgi:hypothetical protein
MSRFDLLGPRSLDPTQSRSCALLILTVYDTNLVALKIETGCAKRAWTFACNRSICSLTAAKRLTSFRLMTSCNISRSSESATSFFSLAFSSSSCC